MSKLSLYSQLSRPAVHADSLTTTENHPSWKHMYLIMMGAQVAFALAYMF